MFTVYGPDGVHSTHDDYADAFLAFSRLRNQGSACAVAGGGRVLAQSGFGDDDLAALAKRPARKEHDGGGE